MTTFSEVKILRKIININFYVLASDPLEKGIDYAIKIFSGYL